MFYSLAEDLAHIAIPLTNTPLSRKLANRTCQSVLCLNPVSEAHVSSLFNVCHLKTDG